MNFEVGAGILVIYLLMTWLCFSMAVTWIKPAKIENIKHKSTYLRCFGVSEGIAYYSCI